MRLCHSQRRSTPAREPSRPRPPAYVLRLFIRAHDEYVLYRAIGPDLPSPTLERVMKLLHLKPGFLLLADGRISRQRTSNVFLTGDIDGILS